MNDDVGFLLLDVPSAVRTAVERDANERQVSMNDTVGEILARRYGLVWGSSGYPFSGTEGAEQWGLRMPRQLREVVKAHAREGNLTMRGCILLALTDHYGLPAESPRKRPKRLPHGRPRGRKGAKA